ncbi:hypothetical protein [Solimonas sp. K1W22B-7]|uniref:hypothetical protein n=1 Tax=Solimonas sp. K1W22B-7 TaxID=2303331 RepID=UPI0013C49A6C|nr:hypothetical protein [Solimonas sp. K1W22B-7]
MKRSKVSTDQRQEHSHLRWLVESRAANQLASLRLLAVIDSNHQKIRRSRTLSLKAQILVGACFSLWRAAFLADKTGAKEAVLTNTRAFLAKMLADNAIAYPQDRASREWTFNYYMNSAGDCLLLVADDWPDVERALHTSGLVNKASGPRRRWEYYQAALEIAVSSFEASFGRTRKSA